MRITLFGSSIVSSYWNGALTYYQGLCKAMAARGHEIVFVEPDLYERQSHRDVDVDPAYAEVRVCRGWEELARELGRARRSDVVIKCSGVGGWDDELAAGVLEGRREGQVVAFLDVDAPRTLADAGAEAPASGFRGLIPRYDVILLYGGGPPVERAYAELGARRTCLVYNAADPDEHRPVRPDPDRRCDLLFMGNRMPDREERVRELFLRAAGLAPHLSFVLGGNGWGDAALPSNVRWVGPIPVAEHRAWNSSARAVLNVVRRDMAEMGWSPPTRVFEAAGCASCVITDAWTGVEHFFRPDEEILVAATAEEVVGHLGSLSVELARRIGEAARARVLRDHTYEQRAAILERELVELRDEQAVHA